MSYGIKKAVLSFPKRREKATKDGHVIRPAGLR